MRSGKYLLAAAILASPAVASAALFSENFESDVSADWNINRHSNDTEAIFGWDYSTAGIPAAPGSTTTRGLKFTANNNVDNANTNLATALTVSPKNQNFTDTSTGYRVRFHMWINANGPFPAGGTGSTEVMTAGIGYNNTTVNRQSGLSTTITGSGAWFAVNGEGGATRDFQAYKNASEQFAESLQFAAGNSSSGTGNAHDHLNSYYQTRFPGQAPPSAQSAAHASQTGNLADGAVGFAWRLVEIAVQGTTARWSIDGHTIATLDTQIGNTFPLTGNISLGYSDPYNSLSSNTAMSFGLIDNLEVSLIPEPTSLALLGVGALGLLARGRRTA